MIDNKEIQQYITSPYLSTAANLTRIGVIWAREFYKGHIDAQIEAEMASPSVQTFVWTPSGTTITTTIGGSYIGTPITYSGVYIIGGVK